MVAVEVRVSWTPQLVSQFKLERKPAFAVALQQEFYEGENALLMIFCLHDVIHAWNESMKSTNSLVNNMFVGRNEYTRISSVTSGAHDVACTDTAAFVHHLATDFERSCPN